MQRRNFIKNSAKLALGLGIGMSLGFSTVKNWYDNVHGSLVAGDLAAIKKKLDDDFRKLLEWLRDNGWTGYLKSVLDINLDEGIDDINTRKEQLIKKLDPARLAKLCSDEQAGFDDFAGERLIQPGFPAYSLLFHALASPRVRPRDVKKYPDLKHIDLLENYIYALSKWEDQMAIYGIKQEEELVAAVFAYEYRPAFKTPHHSYADIVYSRTGIARVGDQPLNYDKINRCFVNLPAKADKEKNIAVTPARYGLFLARKVSNKDLSLLSTGLYKGGDSKDDRNDASKTFLLPIRKLFNDDELVKGELKFTEFHKSEKLQKFVQIKGVEILHGLQPTARFSAQLIEPAPDINSGSTFLVVPKAEALIRPAMEQQRTLFFKVPHKEKTEYDNRFFTALATQKVEDVELLDGSDPLYPDSLGRIYARYPSPRNQPMFVNITNEADTTKETFHPIDKKKDADFENKINAGGYYAPLFEDSLCDGRVEADLDVLTLDSSVVVSKHCLPAFSIVTAPDFFPLVDPLDLAGFDVAPGTSSESNFYEGGVASLATARIVPNPKMITPAKYNPTDTYLAVLSASVNSNSISGKKPDWYKDPKRERGYEPTGFLPDVASSVFAPGWDVTYCSLDNIHDIYIGTEGLGSPFIEDMKFCSALNGMWPATSPDAARTYQGGLESKYRNPTAVPLLDEEIGICGDGPAGKLNNSTGWDGEQGPYLQPAEKPNKWKINFTDIGRADAVTNALNGTIDMSKLRKLTCIELINRMECLRKCIEVLPPINFNNDVYKQKIPGYTYWWLLSAEKVNWGKENAKGLNMPDTLAGDNKGWLCNKQSARVKGEGISMYLLTLRRMNMKARLIMVQTPPISN